METTRKRDAHRTKIAVVIPCYKVAEHINAVLSTIPQQVFKVYVVDDKCPEETGRLVEASNPPDRITVIFHEENKGVGGATKTGIQRALDDGAEIIVKIDGDGQMDPRLIPAFVAPIVASQADCSKGNRFFDIDGIRSMPPLRIFGNSVLSFMAKLSTGYWHIFDPTNGFLAFHAAVARHVPWGKIADSYFFETDLLFRLNLLRAVVAEVPMKAVYGNEQSSLSVPQETLRFFSGHCRNFVKRLFYNYYLRNFSIASIELVVAFIGLGFGIIFGSFQWYEGAARDTFVSAGTVMLAALPVLIGVQSMLAFFNHDVSSVPTIPLFPRLIEKAQAQSRTTDGAAS